MSNGLSYPKELRLKDGCLLVIRPTTPDDTEGLIEFYRSIPEQDRHVLRRDVTNRQIMQERLTEIELEYLIAHVALLDGMIIGEATIFSQPYGWFRHIGDLRIILDPRYRSRGIGAMLTADMIEVAVHRNLDKIMVHLMESQVQQIQRLKKMGFVEEAKLRNHITDHRGDKHNLVIMTHYVADLWRQMEDLILDSEALFMRS